MLQREREMQSVVTTTTTASPFRLGKNVPTVTSPLVERGLLLLPILSSCWGPCSHEHLTAYKAFMPTLALNWRHNTSWTRGNLSSTLLLLTPAETSDWDRENKRKFWGGEAKKAHYSLSISLAPWLSRRHGIWLKHSGSNLYQQIQRDALLTSENLTQLRYPLKQSQWQEPFFFFYYKTWKHCICWRLAEVCVCCGWAAEEVGGRALTSLASAHTRAFWSFWQGLSSSSPGLSFPPAGRRFGPENTKIGLSVNSWESHSGCFYK